MLSIRHIKTGSKNRALFLLILIFNSFLAIAKGQNLPENKAVTTSAAPADTLRFAPPAEQLDDIVRTQAEEERSDYQNKMIYLYRKAQVRYQDMQIDADYISIDLQKNIIFARGKIDSTGKVTEPAVATQGGKTYRYNEFNYNYKSRQALAYNARTEENEGVIVAQKTKKYSDSVYFMKKGLYTTDEFYIKGKDSTADYHLLAPTIKMIKGKEKSQIITGPIQMYIEQVPTPLVLPFALLPLSDKRSAGILVPSFGERQDVGFYLNGLGYYQPIGEHFDLKILADVYTKGSWNVRPELNYIKRYRYNGNFSADVGTTVVGIKGLDNYSKSRTYRIAWRHSQDYKANPLFNFSASVDIVSNKFYNRTINNNYIFNQNVLNTQQNSSINVTKRFLRLPVTLTAAASYSQNFATGNADLRFPTLNVAVNQFYLFPSKTGVRTGLLENINVNTGLNITNFVNTNEGEIFRPAMWEKMQTGARNNISLGTNTTIAKYFTFSLNAQIDNALTTKTVSKRYNPITNVVENTVQKGISGYSTFSTGVSMQTTLYGTKMFRKGSLIQGIRHMMSPSVSFTYAPDFGDPRFGYYRNYYDANGAVVNYSIFEQGVIGSPATGRVGQIGFSINNNIEMKVRSKSDSTGVKKVKIFESFNITGGYNFAASSHRWSTLNVNGQTSLFQNKMSINSSLILDPYEIQYQDGGLVGVRTENFGHFSVQRFGVQLAYPLSDAIFGKRKTAAEKYSTRGEVRNEVYYFDRDNYAHWEQPWTLNINATYEYTKALSRFGNTVASLGLDGSLKLTPYWGINGSAHYDFVNREITYIRLGFARDQRSFSINFNWVPFGPYKVYDFFIGIKANILRDALKYKENSFTQPNAPF